jgi:parallel beta-helix repeat protein
VNNTCNNNRIGIYLYDLGSNTVENNTFSGNTEHDILEEFETEEFVAIDPVVLLVVGLAGITLLGAGWRMAELSGVVSKGEYFDKIMRRLKWVKEKE